jgi:hypothetical protein
VSSRGESVAMVVTGLIKRLGRRGRPRLLYLSPLLAGSSGLAAYAECGSWQRARLHTAVHPGYAAQRWQPYGSMSSRDRDACTAHTITPDPPCAGIHSSSTQAHRRNDRADGWPGGLWPAKSRSFGVARTRSRFASGDSSRCNLPSPHSITDMDADVDVDVDVIEAVWSESHLTPRQPGLVGPMPRGGGGGFAVSGMENGSPRAQAGLRRL